MLSSVQDKVRALESHILVKSLQLENKQVPRFRFLKNKAL